MEKNPEVAVMRMTSVAETMGWELYSRTMDDKGNVILSFRLVTHPETTTKPVETAPAEAIPS